MNSDDVEYNETEKVFDDPDSISAHNLGKDNPWEVGFQLATAIDNAFILGYPLLVMAFLGWVAGPIMFIGGGLISLYANITLAKLAVIDGVRYYRFRDISRKIYGSFGYWLTLGLQWGNILAGNVGLIILMGQALEGIYYQYYEFGTGIKLPIWIVFTGLFVIVLSLSVPDLHYLRQMSIIAGACGVIFCSIVLGISIHDGSTSPPRRYDTGLDEDQPTKIFDILGTTGTIAFAYSTVIIPEIQATIRNPPVENFYKAMIVNYGFGAPIFLTISFVSFWAYGSGFSGVGINVINNLSGPKWAIILAWCGVFVQSAVSFMVYGFPFYEFFDTWLNRPGGPWVPYNIGVRIMYRVPYICLTTFVAALLPFFGDFIALIGSMTVLPCNFVLTFLLHIAVNRERMSATSIIVHYFLVAFFVIITLVSSVAALRYIIVDSINYSVFANL